MLACHMLQSSSIHSTLYGTPRLLLPIRSYHCARRQQHETIKAYHSRKASTLHVNQRSSNAIMLKRATLLQCSCVGLVIVTNTCDIKGNKHVDRTDSDPLDRQQAILIVNNSQASDGSKWHNKRRLRESFVDDDWKYHPNRQLEEGQDNNGQKEDADELNEDGNNNAKQHTNDDCTTENNYLSELVNHMLHTTPEDWTINEIILGCCLASIALSTLLMTSCCVYGCCATYCCCCYVSEKSRSKRNFWDDDTTVSRYEIDYQFTNESSLV